jgi:CRISPR-associated RAMP protein (TIGR02581 family)
MTAPLPLLDTFQGRLRLEGVVTTQTALHIGAGGSGDALGTDSPVVRTATGAPYIPGSSLKGVLRSAAEALYRGGPFQETRKKLWACDPLGDDQGVCVSHKQAEKIRKPFLDEAAERGEKPDPRKMAEALWEKTCSICQLFGSLALASRVRFADLPVRGEAPLFELRNGVGIDRDKELAASGVLYDFEAVAPETQFDLRVTVDNPTDAEVGLLLYLFQELDAGNLTLGGKASRGLGRVRVTWERIEEITLNAGNPFAALLSTQELLATSPRGGAADEPRPAEAPALKIPTTGDAETWKALAGILLELPEIDKSLLGERGAQQGLTKNVLNTKLALGLDERHVRKAWDVALDRLMESGFLAKEEKGGYVVAGRKAPAAASAVAAEEPVRAPALQIVIDRYLGAMARLWEER